MTDVQYLQPEARDRSDDAADQYEQRQLHLAEADHFCEPLDRKRRERVQPPISGLVRPRRRDDEVVRIMEFGEQAVDGRFWFHRSTMSTMSTLST